MSEEEEKAAGAKRPLEGGAGENTEENAAEGKFIIIIC